MRIAFAVRVLVVNAMRRHPEDRAALERQRCAPRQDVLEPFVGLVAAVGQQPVIAHADAQHAGDGGTRIERGEDGPGIDEEQTAATAPA